jgi:prepilin-type processing-associated H-X9-DG protein
MITTLLKELKDEWGYGAEELNSIREKMEELSNTCYWDGHAEGSIRNNTNHFYAYGKKEDWV